MKKIIVTDGACIGCGACVAIDNEHFDFNDEGLSKVISNENLESESLTSAIESCPTSAIIIGEGEEDEEAVEECSCNECSCDHCEGHCH